MLQIILLFAPAFISTLLYERLIPDCRTVFRLATITMCFAFLINMLVYAAILLRGQSILLWLVDYNLANVFFCLKYMGLSLVVSVILAFLAAGFGIISGGHKK